MKKFIIREVLEKEVEAESAEEVYDAWMADRIVLYPEDFICMEILDEDFKLLLK